MLRNGTGGGGPPPPSPPHEGEGRRLWTWQHLAPQGVQAGRAPARGVALLRLWSVLYPGHVRRTSERSEPVQKRQPAGTGRRSPGAFGLIPGGAVGLLRLA